MPRPSNPAAAGTPRRTTDHHYKPSASATNRSTTNRSSTITRSVGRPSSVRPDAPNNSNANRITTSRTPRSANNRDASPTRRQPDYSNARKTRDLTTRTKGPTRPRLSDRYQPNDRVANPANRPRTVTRSDVTTRSSKPRGLPRVSGRRIGSGTTAIATPIISGTNPTLVPRRAAPRLGSPRSSSRNGFQTGCAPYAVSSYRWGTRYRNCSFWNGYWGYGRSTYCGFGFGFGYGYNYGNWGYTHFGANCWGFDPFCWNIGALSPYNAFRSNYWNSCYRNTYWNNWSTPNALPSSYWWYPTTSYCPTYLYVPGSVVINEELEPYDEVLSVVDTARSAEVAEVAVEKTTPETLAVNYIELGDFYFENDRFDAATEAYAKAREYAPEDASVHFVLADATFANGDYHYAAFLISEAVRLDPTIVTAKVDKRTFYSDPKLFETQLEALQAYCKAKPYDAWAQLVLGYNLRFSDRPTRSIAAFRRVMQLDADNPPANAFLRDLLPPTKPDGKPSAETMPTADETVDETAKLKKTGR